MTKTLVEGKTKIVTEVPVACLTSKDDLTAGNGAKHDLLPGKAVLATETTCNVFSLLRQFDIPVAFYGKYLPNAFLAPFCRMLPWEVVVRGEAHGSYLKRHPECAKGHAFPKPLVEFYLKTSGRAFKEHSLPCDDPLAHVYLDSEMVELFDPAEPDVPGGGFLTLPLEEVYLNPDDIECFPRMSTLAAKAFKVLRAAWYLTDHKLVDMKVEFGIDLGDNLLLADVIDNDSWRLLPLTEDRYVDKQVYRDCGDLSAVLENYRRVAEATSNFPRLTDRIPVHLRAIGQEV